MNTPYLYTEEWARDNAMGPTVWMLHMVLKTSTGTYTLSQPIEQALLDSAAVPEEVLADHRTLFFAKAAYALAHTDH